jgi:hypothetical protein
MNDRQLSGPGDEQAAIPGCPEKPTFDWTYSACRALVLSLNRGT